MNLVYQEQPSRENSHPDPDPKRASSLHPIKNPSPSTPTHPPFTRLPIHTHTQDPQSLEKRKHSSSRTKPALARLAQIRACRVRPCTVKHPVSPQKAIYSSHRIFPKSGLRRARTRRVSSSIDRSSAYKNDRRDFRFCPCIGRAARPL